MKPLTTEPKASLQILLFSVDCFQLQLPGNELSPNSCYHVGFVICDQTCLVESALMVFLGLCVPALPK